MSDDNNNYTKAPCWLVIVTVIAMLPVLAFPMLLDGQAGDKESRALLWLYPFYVIVSGICAVICYRQRPEVTWILLILMILSHAAMWILYYGY
ncbi:MAG: hypothetical protein ACI4AX_02070 [Muribaculaceae bacterium]